MLGVTKTNLGVVKHVIRKVRNPKRICEGGRVFLELCASNYALDHTQICLCHTKHVTRSHYKESLVSSSYTMCAELERTKKFRRIRISYFLLERLKTQALKGLQKK